MATEGFQYQATGKRIAPPSDAACWAERVGNRAWLGHNAGGSTVLMADPDDNLPSSFAPGELLKLALAGCVGMTGDGPIGRRLGEDFAGTIVIGSSKHATDDRYEAFDEQVLLDVAALTPAERDALAAVLTRAVQRGCTVGLTLKNGAAITSHVDAAAS